MEKIKAYLSKDLNGCVDIWNKKPEFDRNIGCFLNDEDSLDLYAGELAELENFVNEGQCVEITITKGDIVYDYNNSPEGKLMNAIFGGK